MIDLDQADQTQDRNASLTMQGLWYYCERTINGAIVLYLFKLYYKQIRANRVDMTCTLS